MRIWIILAALGAAAPAHTQPAARANTGAPAPAEPVAARVSTAADRDLLAQLVAREDSRDPMTPADARGRGLASSNAFIRAFTVRGLGRLEQPAVFEYLARALGDAQAEVRVAAADAMAQSVARPLPPAAADSQRAHLAANVERVRTALMDQLGVERDASARAALLESIGRLPQGTVQQVKATADAIAPSLAAASVVERRGAIRGLFFLARKREARTAGAIPASATDALYAMLDAPASAGYTPTDRANVAFTLWGAAALDDTRAARLLADPEPFVRERGVVNLARSNDLPFVRQHLQRSFADTAPVVRFRAVGAYAQKLRAADGCAPLVTLTRDADTTVALAAMDALAGCRGDTAVVRHLRSVIATWRDDDHWHLPVHAFLALSAIAPDLARTYTPTMSRARNFFVRMYADSAAWLMRDTATLHRLTRDPHPNVQASALAGLSRLVGHAADAEYLRALESDENQVLMVASAALRGSSAPGVDSAAVRRYRERMLRGWDTDIDGNRALAELIASMGIALPQVEVPRVTMALPTYEDLAELERATVRIEMADGSVMTMKLHPFAAPTNAFRFARLVRAGVFDWMTFHRVAPFFVVQGPGPNANEYSAPDKPFAREELALSNVRGSVGLSTRGRDTGDGQIYVNTVDNIWLDHEFTIMGSITSGMEAFDRMQEGARIRRITITP